MLGNRKQQLIKERQLVIARLEVASPELHFSSGATFQNFSRDEMIQEIKNDTSAGREFVRVEMEFLRAFKDGKFLQSIIANKS